MGPSKTNARSGKCGDTTVLDFHHLLRTYWNKGCHRRNTNPERKTIRVRVNDTYSMFGGERSVPDRLDSCRPRLMVVRQMGHIHFKIIGSKFPSMEKEPAKTNAGRTYACLGPALFPPTPDENRDPWYLFFRQSDARNHDPRRPCLLFLYSTMTMTVK